MKSPVTIKEIAKLAGVSPAAVSLVLNGKRGVSKETTKLILSIAKKSSYRPNAIAKSLVRRKTSTIGLIVSDIVDPFYAELSRGVEDAAFRNGFSIILCDSDDQRQKEDLCVDLLLTNQVAGLILSPLGNEAGPKLQEAAKLVPVVLVDRSVRTECYATVVSKNIEGAAKAVRHLIELGHKRIACITLLAAWSTSYERVEGYRQALQEHSLEFDKHLVLHSNGTLDGGRECAKALLKMDDPPTAIFATSDIVAFGVIQTVLEAGLQVPRDLSVVGFDNISQSEYFRVPLTTVDQPKYGMGEAACKLLLRKIHGVSSSDETIRLDTRLVVRQSTAKLRAGL